MGAFCHVMLLIFLDCVSFTYFRRRDFDTERKRERERKSGDWRVLESKDSAKERRETNSGLF